MMWLADNWLLTIGIVGLIGCVAAALVYRTRPSTATQPWLGVIILVTVAPSMPWYLVLPIAFISSALWTGAWYAFTKKS
jgi:uncharacterized membrane protein